MSAAETENRTMGAEDGQPCGTGQVGAADAAGLADAPSPPVEATAAAPESAHAPVPDANANALSVAEVRNIVEAALLAAGKPLTLSELAHLFDDSQRPQAPALRAALAQLHEDYAERALEVKETAAGFRVQVRSRYAGVVSRLWPERPQRYSRALLETLALIAYRQPITRAEIEAVRGVAVNPNIIKTLLERQWIRVVGTRDLPGRPELLGTTRDFLDYFGLKNLDELPPLAQLRSLGDLEPQLDIPVAADATPPFEPAAAATDASGALSAAQELLADNAAAAAVAGDAAAEAWNDENADVEDGGEESDAASQVQEPIEEREPYDDAANQDAEDDSDSGGSMLVASSLMPEL
jgi:segregation and condensation protein B